MIPPAVIASALPPGGPSSGDGEGVDCVVGRVSAADRLAIAEPALSDTPDQAGAVEAESRFSDHLVACAQLHGWDDAQILRVSTLGVSRLVQDVARARLAGAGIDGAALDLWFDRQSEEFRTTAFHTMDEAEFEAALMTLQDSVMAADLLEAHAGLVGGYLAMRVLAVRVERGLPIE